MVAQGSGHGNALGVASFQYISEERNLVPNRYTSRFTLESLIESKVIHGYSIPLKSRMLLVLKLVSNLAQLSQTPWLRACWSGGLVCFSPRPNSGEDICHRIDFTRPYISSTFKQNDIGHAPQEDVTPELAISELGTVLLEIWFQKSIASQFPNGTLRPHSQILHFRYYFER
jgi:hypothetical protein